MLQLPRPKRAYVVHSDAEAAVPATGAASPAKGPPAYRQRKGFVPRAAADFGDGGAFPEVHVAQFPLGMGRKSSLSQQQQQQQQQEAGSTLAVTVDGTGLVEYDAVAKSSSSGRVQTRYEDLVARNATAESQVSLRAPDADEEAATAARTAQALGMVMDKQEEQLQVVGKKQEPAKYVAYHPAGGGESRVVRVVQAAQDPLDLPAAKFKRQPRAAQVEAPAPVLHAPGEKLTPEQRQDWVIPPCVSSWKNPKGFTIPLDKRMAADGRDGAAPQVSDKFASLSEALYVAENQARQEIEARNREKQFLLRKGKEQHEEELRNLAAQARREQREIAAAPPPALPSSSSSSSSSSRSLPGAAMTATAARTPASPGSAGRDVDSDDGRHSGGLGDIAGERERERLRRERRKELERSMRLDGKRGRGSRDGERDVSERIALGMAAPKQARVSGEAKYDARLYNQAGEGLSSGFGPDDEYNVYSKPLFARPSESIYRPRASEASRMGSASEQLDRLNKQGADRFRPARGLGSTSGEGGAAPPPPRTGPVQFERAQPDAGGFDFGSLGDASSERRVGERLDKAVSGARRGGGLMAAAGGSSAGAGFVGSGRSQIRFEKGGA